MEADKALQALNLWLELDQALLHHDADHAVQLIEKQEQGKPPEVVDKSKIN